MPAQKNTPPSASASNAAAPNIDVTNPYIPRRPSPLISISVNHPIATAARKIKNFLIHKQTLFSTSFTIKVTPIVALVSFFGVAALFGGSVTTAFNFGKTVEQRFMTAAISPTPIKPSPTPQIIVKQPAIITTSRSGTIKATYQLPPTSINTPGLTVSQTNNEGSVSATPLTPTPLPILHYILVSRSGSIVFLSTPTTLHLQNYLNLRVLITGTFDTTKNTLSVAKPEDIEILQ